MGKRDRLEVERVSVEEAREAWKIICNMVSGNVCQDDEVTHVPYLGIVTTSGRPPVDLNYVGTDDAYSLLGMLLVKPKLLIYGPRGFGKSSDLRAVVCAAYVYIFEKGSADRLVGIWNMGAALDDLVSAVRNAILFTYLMPSRVAPESSDLAQTDVAESSTVAETDVAESSTVVETDAAESVKSATVSEASQAVEGEILRIASIDDAIQFIKKRKAMHKESFHFFADGWEVLDETDSQGIARPRKHQRQLVQNQLMRLFSEGDRVWLCASAESNMVRKEKGWDVHVKSEPFNATQYDSYLRTHSILARLSKLREEDILEYTGLVPMFLDVMHECCREYGKRKADVERAKVKLQFKHVHHVKPAKVHAMLAQAQKAAVADEKQLAELLEDDENWQQLLKMFRDHKAVEEVEDCAAKIVLDEPCYSTEEMAKKDATYFNLKRNEYCSRYVHRIFAEEFRRKEARIQRHAGGAWLPYCRYLIGQVYVNWADLGWVVEGLIADVIANRKVYMGKKIGKLADLYVEEFKEIPSLHIANLRTTKPGSGYYFKPRLFNFPYVDGVIIYVDMQGTLHVIGLQVTLNVDQHLASALLFMRLWYLKTWFPDLDNYKKDMQLHFIFLGCSQQYSEEHSRYENERVRGKKSCGIAGYTWSFIPLTKALECLNSEEMGAVQSVVATRKFKSSTAAFMQLTRKELDEIAETYGLDPAQFSKKKDLVDQLEQTVFLKHY